jgi:branched-chain amino acid transport system substrate-binding protein
MRTFPFFALLATVVGGSVGCAALVGLDEYTTADRPSGELNGADAAVLPPVAAPDGQAADAAAPGCRTYQECNLHPLRQVNAAGNDVARVCVRATGKCEPLVTPECPRVIGDFTNDNAVFVGALLSDGSASLSERAASLAVEEIDADGQGLRSSSGVRRPLVLVACNGTANPLTAARHLAEDLRVPAIVGPNSFESVLDVTQQVTVKAGTLLMTPSSSVSSISNRADTDLTWRVPPSDAQRAKLIIEQIKDLETLLRATRGLTTIKMGVVYATDTLGTSAYDAIAGKLILNGRFINDTSNAANVSVDSYAPGATATEAGFATKYATTVKPDIVYLTSAEQVEHVMVPLEQALTAARAVARPYYVLAERARSQALLDAVASSLPADIRRRIRGVGVRPDTASVPVLSDFRAAFAARYGIVADGLSTVLSYDATYALAYAISLTASTAPTGTSLAHGLRTLSVGSAVTVGKDGWSVAKADLTAGKSVSLRGTHGLVQWDSNGDINAGTVEVWCVGTNAGAPAFGSSGVTMDVQTQVVGGGYVQCQ